MNIKNRMPRGDAFTRFALYERNNDTVTLRALAKAFAIVAENPRHAK